MEAAAALGVASSICQLLDFASKLVASTHQIYRNGSGTSVRKLHLETAAETIATLGCSIREFIQQSEASGILSSEEAHLKRICGDVIKVGSTLVDVLDRVTCSSGNRTWASFREALCIIWNEDKIADILGTLKVYRDDIDTFVLVLIRQKIDHVADVNMTMRTRFESVASNQSDLSAKLTDYISTDTRWKADLIRTIYRNDWRAYDSGSKMFNHITGLSKELTKAATADRELYLRRKFLARLQFPAMRDRQNRISRAHKDTFRWVFKRAGLQPATVARAGALKQHLSEGMDRWLKRCQGFGQADITLTKVPRADFSEEHASNGMNSWPKRGQGALQADTSPKNVPQANILRQDDSREENVSSGFARWLESGRGIFWVTGKPASGKSTLMKYIQEASETSELLEKWKYPASQLLFCTYFFWKAGHEMQKTQLGLLQTIICDALHRRPAWVSQVFPERWNRYQLFGDDIDPWSWPELLVAFEKLAKLIDKSSDTKAFFMIDGLDECEGDHAELVQLLQSATEMSQHIKLLLGSRPEQHFQDAFGRLPNLRMQDLTLPDILAYVDSELCKQAQFEQFKARYPVYSTNLVRNIATKASGVFLWVTFVVKSLIAGIQNGDRVSELQTRLARIPPELDDLYSSMLTSLEPLYLKQASHIFQILRAAPGQLNLLDLSFTDEEPNSSNESEFLDDDEVKRRHDASSRRLNSRCKGLIEVSLRLSPNHQTVTSEQDVDSTEVQDHSVNSTEVPEDILAYRSRRYGDQDRSLLVLPQSQVAVSHESGAPQRLSPAEPRYPPLSGRSDASRSNNLLERTSNDFASQNIRTGLGPAMHEATGRYDQSLRPHRGPGLNERTDYVHGVDLNQAGRMRLVHGLGGSQIDFNPTQNSPRRKCNQERPYPFSESWLRRRRRKVESGPVDKSLPVFYRGNDSTVSLSCIARTSALDSFELLEIDYLHRTAKDFLDREINWRVLKDASDPSFNPRETLAQSSILLLARVSPTELTVVKLWAWLDWCVACANAAALAGHPVNAQWVSKLDAIVSKLVNLPNHDGRTLIEVHQQQMRHELGAEMPDSHVATETPSNYHWTNTEPGRYELGGNIATFCIQNGLSSYIESQSKTLSANMTRDEKGRPLLDYVWLRRPVHLQEESTEALDSLQAAGSIQNYQDISPMTVQMTSLLLAKVADPNEWYANGTPWIRVLQRMYEAYQRGRERQTWHSSLAQRFIIFSFCS